MKILASQVLKTQVLIRGLLLYYTLVIDLIGQLHRDVIGRLSVKL